MVGRGQAGPAPGRQPRPKPLWLYGVARRTLANQRRGADRAARLAARVAQQTADAPAADAGLAEADDLRGAMRALSALGEADQELLRLTLWEELSHAQVAVVLGTPVPNVAVSGGFAHSSTEWSKVPLMPDT